MKKIFIAFLMSIAFIACVNTDYIGKSFAPTTNVDVYFSEADVEKEYEVMGKITEESSEFISFEKLQEKMVEQAMEKGADGIIIGGMQKVETGSSSYTSGSVDNDITQDTFTSSTSNVSIKDNVLHGTLIKYSK